LTNGGEKLSFEEKFSTNKFYSFIILILPAIVAFFITLIPTIYNSMPLSWDIYRHIHFAEVYTNYGLVFTDPLINIPTGERITYPPLFQLIIALVGNLTNINYFEITRALQPVMAFLLVLSVSYVGKKFYGLLAGVSSGFLIISSAMYSRIVLALPENLALVLLPLGIYFYYKSLTDKKYSYALLSGLILILMFTIHRMVPLALIVVVTLFTLYVILKDKDLNAISHYIVWAFMAFLVIFGILVLLILYHTDLMASILGNLSKYIIAFISFFIYDYNQPFPLSQYPTFLGYMVTLFGVIGLILGFIKREKKDILLIIWTFSMFLFSISYLIGINIVSFRLLLYILLPLSILGGVGVKFIFDKLSTQKTLMPRTVSAIFLAVVVGLSVFYCGSIALNPKIATFGVNTEFGTIPTAPPSNSEFELAAWFQKNGDKTKMAASSNYYTAIFLLAMTNQPIYKSNQVLTGNKSRDYLVQNRVKYLIYDKRLNFSSTNKPVFVSTDSNQLLFYNKKINARPPIPSFARVVYENKEFIVCIVY
jgi:hypothetical protein